MSQYANFVTLIMIVGWPLVLYSFIDRICRCVEACTMAKAYASTVVAQGGVSTRLTDWLEILNKATKGGEKR